MGIETWGRSATHREVDYHEMVSTTTFSDTLSATRLVDGTGNAGTHTSGPVLSLSLSIRPSLKQRVSRKVKGVARGLRAREEQMPESQERVSFQSSIQLKDTS